MPGFRMEHEIFNVFGLYNHNQVNSEYTIKKSTIRLATEQSWINPAYTRNKTVRTGKQARLKRKVIVNFQ